MNAHLPIDAYRAQVKESSENAVAGRIANRSIQHAGILIEFLFKSATAKVRLVCGNLNADFYETTEFDQLLNDFLKKDGAELSILLADAAAERGRAFLARHSMWTSGKLKVATSSLISDSENHFLVVDEKAYRYEFSHDSNDSQVVEAVANFNEPAVAKMLAQKFDVMFQKATLLV